MAWCQVSIAGPQVTDDSGRAVTLEKPAQRIISLAPHLTENMFTIGAGDRIVGVSQYSDYPAAAANIVRVGDYQAINIEKILSLQPDLILAWSDGGNDRSLGRLADLGIPIYWSRPVTIDSIAGELRNLAVLTGRESYAKAEIDQFTAAVSQLEPARRQPPVRVFYQVWASPLQTLGSNTLIGDMIVRCGGSNIFADAKVAVAQVDIETVLARDPELIIGSHPVLTSPEWMSAWLRWPAISAVANRHIYSIEADFLSRHTVRALTGAQHLCRYMRGLGR